MSDRRNFIRGLALASTGLIVPARLAADEPLLPATALDEIRFAAGTKIEFDNTIRLGRPGAAIAIRNSVFMGTTFISAPYTHVNECRINAPTGDGIVILQPRCARCFPGSDFAEFSNGEVSALNAIRVKHYDP